MSNIVLNTLVTENNYIAIANYLRDKNLEIISEDDILEAINIIDNETHHYQIKELLYQFLIINDVKISIEGDLSAQDIQLFKNLFRYALFNNKLDLVKEMLNVIGYGSQALNQTNNNKTLVEEAIASGNDDVFEFLLNNNANINSAINRYNFLNHPEKIERIAECGGDFSNVINQNPELLFMAAQQSEQYPKRFQQALNVSPDLLYKLNFTQTSNYRNTHVYANIFEQTIHMQNWPLLTACLQHVKNVVIQQQKTIRCLDVEKPIAHKQMINCALLLDYCIALSKSTDEHIQKAFQDAQLSFEYNPNITDTESDAFFFNQGLLRFLKLYDLDQVFPDLAPISYPEDKQIIVKADVLLSQTAQEIGILASTEYYRFIPIVISIHLMHLINAADGLYKTNVREPYLKEQQRIATQREQQLQHAREEQLRIATALSQQIEVDLRLNLSQLYTELLEIINEISKVNNNRDHKKINLDYYGDLISFTTFLTTYVFACLMIHNYFNDNKQASINNFLISFGTYVFESITIGFLNGLFAHNQNNVNDRMLEFGHLPQALQNKITDLMQRLAPLHLSVEIAPDCRVNQLIDLLLSSARKSNQRLIAANQNPENINPIPLINYLWNAPRLSKKYTEIILFSWVVALVVQAIISWLIGVNNNSSNNDNRDPNMIEKLYSAMMLTFFTLPITLLMHILEKGISEHTASNEVGHKLTTAYNCITTTCTRPQNPRTHDIEMQLLTRNNS